MAEIDQKSHDELLHIMTRLERHYRDMCDIEFTVERGKLWMRQTRVCNRTPEGAFRIAVHMFDEGLIQMDEAVLRVTGEQLALLMFPRFDESAARALLATGMNASPGAAVGKAVFDSDTAVEWAARGDDVILVRKETNPDDLRGMVAARGILTSRGGKTSHAAVVARGMGRTCVCGAEALDVDTKAKEFRVRDGVTVREGDVISIDGSTGEVFAGAVPVADSVVVRHFEGEKLDDDLAHAVARIMAHADGARRLRVRTNADTPEDAARARRFGAQGIGLCRTEHMFLGERRELVEKLIVAEDDAAVEAALAALLPLQRDDFTGILEAIREESEKVLAEVCSDEGIDVKALIGTMIEVPRAVRVRHDPRHRVGQVVVELLALEVADHDGVGHRHGTREDLAGAAVDGDDVALADRHAVTDAELLALGVDVERRGAAHARTPQPAGDDGGVRGLAAATREDAAGGDHAAQVVGVGLLADQDHVIAPRGPLHRGVGVEDRLAHRRAGGGVHPLRQQGALGRLVEAGEHQLGELVARDAQDRLVHLDQALVDHVDGDPERGLGGALADAGLQHPELAALDGELDVAHVAVVPLEPAEDGEQFLVQLREMVR
jgi:phosphohistidine swiveling domain-containing protein